MTVQKQCFWLMWPSSHTVCMNLKIYIIISILLVRLRNNTKTCRGFFVVFFFLFVFLTLCYLSLIALLELKVGSQGLLLTSNTHIVVVHTIYMLPVGYLLISHISFHINAVGTQVHLCCISAPKHQSL